jgi:hypothetical protein
MHARTHNHTHTHTHAHARARAHTHTQTAHMQACREKEEKTEMMLKNDSDGWTDSETDGGTGQGMSEVGRRRKEGMREGTEGGRVRREGGL